MWTIIRRYFCRVANLRPGRPNRQTPVAIVRTLLHRAGTVVMFQGSPCIITRQGNIVISGPGYGNVGREILEQGTEAGVTMEMRLISDSWRRYLKNSGQEALIPRIIELVNDRKDFLFDF